jgi:hypothetical protein
MGYAIQAIVGLHEALSQHVTDFKSARVIPLAEGIAMIPITGDLYEKLGGKGHTDVFVRFTSAIEDWAQRISHQSPVGYVEAEYFGGAGSQSAEAWSG